VGAGCSTPQFSENYLSYNESAIFLPTNFSDEPIILILTISAYILAIMPVIETIAMGSLIN
jgi:hypothetical protein